MPSSARGRETARVTAHRASPPPKKKGEVGQGSRPCLARGSERVRVAVRGGSRKGGGDGTRRSCSLLCPERASIATEGGPLTTSLQFRNPFEKRIHSRPKEGHPPPPKKKKKNE